MITSDYRDSNHANRLDQLMSSGGDGTGTVNLATAGTAYTIVSPASTITYIRRVCILIQDGNIRLNRFAGEATLTVGITFTYKSTSGSVLHTYNPCVIKDLNDFGLLAGVDIPSLPDTGDDTWSCRWTIQKGGSDLTLQPGEVFEMDVGDSLAGLTKFFVQCQGDTKDA